MRKRWKLFTHWNRNSSLVISMSLIYFMVKNDSHMLDIYWHRQIMTMERECEWIKKKRSAMYSDYLLPLLFRHILMVFNNACHIKLVGWLLHVLNADIWSNPKYKLVSLSMDCSACLRHSQLNESDFENISHSRVCADDGPAMRTEFIYKIQNIAF